MATKQNAIICIAAGISQEVLIQKIKERNLAVIGVDRNPNAPGMQYCDARVIESTYNAEGIIDALEKLKPVWNFIGIVAQSSGTPLVTAAIVAEHFKLRFVSSEAARIAVNKNQLVQQLRKRGVPVPRVEVIHKEGARDVSFEPPFFVKPSNTVRSHTGMEKIESRALLPEAIERAFSISENDNVNVEEYIEGVDITSIDWVCNHKIIHIATIEEIHSGPPHFYGLGWKIPVSTAAEETAKNMQKQLIEALDINNSLVETAMRFDGARACIYEVGLDLGGDGVPDVVLPKSLQYDLLDNAISVAIGEMPKAPVEQPKPLYLRFFLQSQLQDKDTYARIAEKFGGEEVYFKGLLGKMDDEIRAGAAFFTDNSQNALQMRTEAFEKWFKSKQE